MRDPKRIDDVMYALEQLWLDNPDMRLTQLIYNVVFHGGDGTSVAGVSTEFYNVEEKQIMAGIEKMMNR